ncbi:TPA: YhbY family RNA-binding protein [Candidatus Woesearchaeota archaeon]|nr:YhbY family RNA-binding protein [Candidatus Woesearchaeota archaeon]
MTRDMNELKMKGKHLEPIVRLGKNGLTESAMEQIKKALMKRELIKVKFLRSFTESNDRKEAAKQIAEQLKATLVEQVGLVAVYFKPGGRPQAPQTPKTPQKPHNPHTRYRDRKVTRRGRREQQYL